MGNVLFRCCSTSSQARRVSSRRRRSTWEKLLSTCGLEGSEAPPKQSRSSNNEKASPSDGPCNEWFLENMCATESLDSARQRKSGKQVPRSRSTSRASIIPLPKEDPKERLLRPMKEGWRADSPGYASSPSESSPKLATNFFNQHGYKQLHGKSSLSRPSPLSGGSQDMTKISSSQQQYVQSSVSSPPSSVSHSIDPTTMSLIQLPSSPQRHVDSATCSSVPGPISVSPDAMSKSFTQHCYQPISESPDTFRESFNQHCYQQLYPAPPKKRRSPRRYTKAGSGKSSRRKRIGMRSPSHRTSASKSPARNISGRIEDNEDERSNNDTTAPSRKTPSSRSLGKLLKERDEKSSKSKSLATALMEDMEETDIRSSGIGTRSQSQSHKKPYTKSPGRLLNQRILDYEQSSSTHYTSFSVNQGGMVSPISRRAALALIGRQKTFGGRKHTCRHWKPDLESIAETF